MLLHVTYVVIEVTNIFIVKENKSSLGLKPEAEYVLYSVFYELCYFIKIAVWSENVLVIVTNLDHHRRIKHLLQITSDFHLNGVADVQPCSLWALAHQEVKALALFDPLQNLLESMMSHY